MDKNTQKLQSAYYNILTIVQKTWVAYNKRNIKDNLTLSSPLRDNGIYYYKIL